MPHEFKLGDEVRYKGEPGVGTITWINGPRTHCSVGYLSLEWTSDLQCKLKDIVPKNYKRKKV